MPCVAHSSALLYQVSFFVRRFFIPFFFLFGVASMHPKRRLQWSAARSTRRALACRPIGQSGRRAQLHRLTAQQKGPPHEGKQALALFSLVACFGAPFFAWRGPCGSRRRGLCMRVSFSRKEILFVSSRFFRGLLFFWREIQPTRPAHASVQPVRAPVDFVWPSFFFYKRFFPVALRLFLPSAPTALGRLFPTLLFGHLFPLGPGFSVPCFLSFFLFLLYALCRGRLSFFFLGVCSFRCAVATGGIPHGRNPSTACSPLRRPLPFFCLCRRFAAAAARAPTPPVASPPPNPVPAPARTRPHHDA
ncbi:hypothetical protein [Pandoravirus japonicus]|uniref:Transmembrane protein n=1 Tax=Pandoravirus japonicus TaxID=2823154 RepID=A0A811BPZ5_9VIRU|nr:hypothetical protein [Pandoravirus japonicus]